METILTLSLCVVILFGICLITHLILKHIKAEKKYAKTKQIQTVNAFAEILKNGYSGDEYVEELDICVPKICIRLYTSELDELVSEIERDINENS